VQLYAFHILALDGDDLRKLPLLLRKNNLSRLLARRPEGIFVSEFEQGEIGPALFRKASKFGLGGCVQSDGTAPTEPADRLGQGQKPAALCEGVVLVIRPRRFGGTKLRNGF